MSPDGRSRAAPASAQRQVDAIVQALRQCAGAHLIGVYLHGSLAMGCFAPCASDIDLLAVTDLPLTLHDKVGLARLLPGLSLQPHPIEISLLSMDDLQPWRYPTPFDLHYSESWRQSFADDLASGAWQSWNGVRRSDEDLAAHITVLRARGRCLWGSPIGEVFPPVPYRDYVDSIQRDITWSLNRPTEQPGYAILNLCRTWAYLRTGEVRSKAEGGEWALMRLAENLRPALRAVLAGYAGGQPSTLLADQYRLGDLVSALRNLLASEGLWEP